MAIISCPECGKQVSDRAVSCPECGCPISAAPAAPVQTNPAEELGKLLLLARRAREGADSKNAMKYYGQILDKDPGNWEAIFYSVYYEASECKIMHISSAANSVANCIYSTFSAINDLPSEEEKVDALDQVIASATSISLMFISAAISHYNKFSTTDNAFSECSGRVVAAGNIYSEIEDGYKKVFPQMKERLAAFQLEYVTFLQNHTRWFNSSYVNSVCGRLDREVAIVHPEHTRRRELEQQISSLNGQILGLKTERTAPAGCVGWFFLICGGIMAVLGMALMNVSGDSWPILVAIPELVLAYFFLRKTPTEAVCEENKRKKAELIAQRDALQREKDAL